MPSRPSGISTMAEYDEGAGQTSNTFSQLSPRRSPTKTDTLLRSLLLSQMLCSRRPSGSLSMSPFMAGSGSVALNSGFDQL